MDRQLYQKCTENYKIGLKLPLFEFKVATRQDTNFLLPNWLSRRIQLCRLNRTYALFLWYFILLLCVNGSQSIKCNMERNIPWRDTPDIVTIEWLPELVCDSSEECYGTPDVFGASFPVQLCPSEIQVGDSIQIVPSTSPFFAAFPANVTADTFIACPAADSGIQALVLQPTNDVIEISASALTAGSHYFVQLPSVVSFVRCDFGLRINVTVKQFDCSRQGSSLDCSGFGTCITQPQEGVFHCSCLEGYMGYYCEELDGCFSQPCENGGDCHDVAGGLVSREYQCNCTAGFTGVNCTEVIGACTSSSCNSGVCQQISASSYVCECLDGYQGIYCGSEVDECLSTPCQNQATCVDAVAGYQCLCPVHYVGVNCEQVKDYCDDQPCVNDATCSSSFGSYTCVCAPGYTGQNCSIEIDECSSQPCLNNAACEDQINAYRCQCQTGFSGTNCEVNIDDCNPTPCQNGALCVDGINTYICLCQPGFTGSVCSVNINECGSAPCLNGGACEDGINGYTCHCITELFGGINCEIPLNNCSFYPCLNNGICQNLDNLTYECICTGRYTGQICQTYIPYCTDHNCTNGAVCIEEVAGFSCLCAKGFAGRSCEVNINDCSTNDCINNSTCVDGIGEYMCRCMSGFQGFFCEENVDECLSDPCLNTGTCLDGIDGYSCLCAPGFTGTSCSIEIDECISKPCQHGGTCVDVVDGYQCDCPLGFNGTDCSEDVDLCAVGYCQNNATSCIEISERTDYICSCATGFTGHDCEVNINECESLPCQNGALCVDRDNGFQCYCLPGYVGEFCDIEINECYGNPCFNNATCIDAINNFTCVCKPGFRGILCEVNIDDCKNADCENGGICVDLIDDYRCECLPGFAGRNCSKNIDECLSNSCMADSTETCIDGIFNYTCKCLPGYRGRHCAINIDECEDHGCLNGADCMDSINGYRCICTSGFTGEFCQTNIDECASNPCGPGTCIDFINVYQCICPSNGFPYDPNCSLLPPCESNPCQNNATCANSANDYTYTCACTPGYEGINCESDINDCNLNNVICQNGGTCVDVFMDYICTCAAGFTGEFCEEDIDECMQHQCMMGSTCQDGIDSYTCICNPGLAGLYCNLTAANCDQNPCFNGATCAVVPDTEGEVQFTCQCPIGFYGEYCHLEVDECSSSPCRNGGKCHDGLAGYTCECVLGFEGPNCEINIDDCPNNECVNGSTCVDGINSYTCRCQDGYEGTLCEQDVDECASDPCNPTTSLCVDFVNRYECFCLNGWRGTQCEINIDDCVGDPCLNNATCLDGVAEYECLCASGFNGTLCEIDINECESTPCQNQALCIDEINGYKCYCTPGYVGDHCELEVDECSSNPCLRNGTCHDFVNRYMCECPTPYRGDDCSLTPCETYPCENEGNCTNMIDNPLVPDGFLCYCAPGYTGQRCEINIDDCPRVNTCCSHGFCIDGIDSYECLCEPGWDGPECCKPIDDCIGNMCQNDATCIDLNEEYRCECQPGWEGALCEHQSDECEPNPCQNGAECVDEFLDYTCECASGWEGRNCTDDVDECASIPCLNNATCHNGRDNFTCQCPPFYMGNVCEVNFDPCDLPFDPCQNNASCLTQSDGTALCKCSAGYEGVYCETDTDECASDPCYNNATCMDMTDGYLCLCVTGFIGDRCEENIDDCMPGVCANGGTCVDLVDGFHCECPPGWNGGNCTDNLDECMSQPCENNATCHDQLDSYVCQCAPGFIGVHCEIDVDECTVLDPCRNGAACIDLVASYECVCAPGFEGRHCEIDKDECIPFPCNNGNCTDHINRYSCECFDGYQGYNCTEDVDECNSAPCQNGAGCINNVNSYNCSCLPGFTGVNCEVDMEVCINSVLCYNGATCIDGPGDVYTCQCVSGFEGESCEVDIDECSSNPCANDATCQDFVDFYNCTCAVGWTGEQCSEDVDECSSNPCQNNGICLEHDPGQGYRCFCPQGFSGKHCQTDFDECRPNPCKNGATCEDQRNGYTCVCPPGFSGSDCSINVDACFRNPCLNGATCFDLENGYLCQCQPGYRGDLCESPEPCLSNPCLNGATCDDSAGESFNCQCLEGYLGPRCGETSPCFSDPCLNDGTCFVNGDGFLCLCQAGFLGPRCEVANPCGSSPCLNGGICMIESVGVYICQCSENFAGRNCEEVVQLSSSTPVPVSESTIPSAIQLSTGFTSRGDMTTSHVSMVTRVSTTPKENTMAPSFTLRLPSSSMQQQSTASAVVQPTQSQAIMFSKSSGDITSIIKSMTETMSISDVKTMSPSSKQVALSTPVGTSVTVTPSHPQVASVSANAQSSQGVDSTMILPQPSIRSELFSSAVIYPTASSVLPTSSDTPIVAKPTPSLPSLSQMSMTQMQKPSDLLLSTVEPSSILATSTSSFVIGPTQVFPSSDLTPPPLSSFFDSITSHQTSTIPVQYTSSQILNSLPSSSALKVDFTSSVVTGSTRPSGSPNSMTSSVIPRSSSQRFSEPSGIPSVSTLKPSVSSSFSLSSTTSSLESSGIPRETVSSLQPSDVITMTSVAATIASATPSIPPISLEPVSLSLPTSTVSSGLYQTANFPGSSTQRMLPTTNILLSSIEPSSTSPTPISASVTGPTQVFPSTDLTPPPLSSDFDSISSHQMSSVPVQSLPTVSPLISSLLTKSVPDLSEVVTDTQRSLAPSGIPAVSTLKPSISSSFSMSSTTSSLESSGIPRETVSSLQPSDVVPMTSAAATIVTATPSIPLISLEPVSLSIPSSAVSSGLYQTANFPGSSTQRMLPTTYMLLSSIAPSGTSPTPTSASVIGPTEVFSSSDITPPPLSSDFDSISSQLMSSVSVQLSSISSFVSTSVPTQSMPPSIPPSASVASPTSSSQQPTTPTTTQPGTTKPTAPPTCRDGLCQNGGLCRNIISSDGVVMARCDCAWNFTGIFCQKELAVSFPSFNGNSFLTHQNLDFSQSATNCLLLSIKTSSTDGLLAYSVSNPSNPMSDFLQLFLEDGLVVYQFSCGLGNVFTVKSTLQVNTDELMTVSVIQHRPVDFSSFDCYATITIGDQTFTSSPRLSFIAPSSLGPLYLGGLPDNENSIAMATQVVGFVGCIRHLQVNQEEFLVFDDAVDGRNIAECQVSNPCLYDPCRNGGNCTLTSDDEWQCECPKHLGGDLCERPTDLCEGNPCHRGGVCISIPEQLSFACLCPHGTAGLICNETVEIIRPHYSGIQYGYMSFIRYARVLNWDFMMHLRLKFTLDDVSRAISNNLLLYSGQRGTHGDDYLSVGVENGYLVYTFDLGSGAAILRSPERLNLSRTVHTLDLGRYRKEGWMKVDNQANASATTQGELIGLNTYRDLFIGGYDIYEIDFLPYFLDYEDGFRGCIYDVEIKAGIPADFVAPGNPPGHVDAGLNIGICGSSECDFGGCQNGAECVELGASYVCNCTGDWTGPLCDETLNPCDPGHDPPPLCSEGSTCVLLPEGYACQCQLGRIGQYCNQDTIISDPLFQGDTSYMAFARNIDFKFDTRIAIEFKPRSTTGILFYAASQLSHHSGDFLSISLAKGIVEFRFSLNGHGDPAVLRSATKVERDNWYRVEISRNNNIGFLRFKSDRAFGFAPGESIGLDLGTDLFVGGAPSLERVNPMAVEDEPESFDGCIRLLVINDKELELTGKGALYGLNVQDCDGTACGHNVCKNGGNCITQPNDDQDFICQCPQPYAGKTCEESIYCEDHLCSPGGICIPDVGQASYQCACSLGYDGPTCKEVIALSNVRFNGDGYFLYRDANYSAVDATITALSVDFKTSANQGLIMWNGQPITSGNTDYLGVGLENGQLKISINLGSASNGIIQPPQVVADGNWHTLFIQRTGSFVTLYVDNFAPLNSDLGGGFTGLDTDGLYYFGGLGLDSDISQLTQDLYSSEFTGCIDNLQLRENLVPKLADAEEGYNVHLCDDGNAS